jgi:hypothetical protein
MIQWYKDTIKVIERYECIRKIASVANIAHVRGTVSCDLACFSNSVFASRKLNPSIPK